MLFAVDTNLKGGLTMHFADSSFNLFLIILTWIPTIIVAASIALVFHKANEEWWKALIPLYCEWTEAQVGNSPDYYFLTFIGAGIAGGAVLVLELPAIALVLFVVSAVFYWCILHNLSLAFGKGAGFAFGLFFLAPIFWPILAFDSSEYQPDLIAERRSSAQPHLQKNSYGKTPEYDPFNQTAPQEQPSFQQISQEQVLESQETHTQQSHEQQTTEPCCQIDQQAPSEIFSSAEPQTLSRKAVVGLVLLILVPIIACCVLAEYLIVFL